MADPKGWIIEVSTEPGFADLATAARILKPFTLALDENPKLEGSAPSADPSSGILRATMTVEDHREGAARDAAVEAFYGALAAAGYDTQKPGWRLNVRTISSIP